MNETIRAQEDVEKSTPSNTPAAGPHARKDLVDDEKTPGTGSLPENDTAKAEDQNEADVGPD